MVSFPVLELTAHFGLGPEGGALEASATQEERRWGDTYRFGVTLEQPLYTFGKLAGSAAAARHGVEVRPWFRSRAGSHRRAAHAYQGALVAREVASRDGRRWVDKVNARLEEPGSRTTRPTTPLCTSASRAASVSSRRWRATTQRCSPSLRTPSASCSLNPQRPLAAGRRGGAVHALALKPLEVYLAMAKGVARR